MIRVLLTLLALLTGATAPCAVAQAHGAEASAIGATQTRDAAAARAGACVQRASAVARGRVMRTEPADTMPAVGASRVATVLLGSDRARE